MKKKKDTKGVPFEITLNVYYYIDDEDNYLLSDEDMQKEFDKRMEWQQRNDVFNWAKRMAKEYEENAWQVANILAKLTKS